MLSKRKLLLFILISSLILTINNSFSNGINPPQPKQIPLSIKCIDESNIIRHELFRVRTLINEKYYETLSFIVDNTIQEIPLFNIKTVTLLKNQAEDSEFLKATLVLNSSKESQVLLRAKKCNDNIELSGFENDGNRVKLELSKCAVIQFSHLITGNDHKPLEAQKAE